MPEIVNKPLTDLSQDFNRTERVNNTKVVNEILEVIAKEQCAIADAKYYLQRAIEHLETATAQGFAEYKD